MSTDKRLLGVLFSRPPGSSSSDTSGPGTLCGRPDTLAARTKLIRRLALYIQQRGLTQNEAAEHFEVSPDRIRDLLNGRIGRFTVGTLINMCICVGIVIDVTFGD